MAIRKPPGRVKTPLGKGIERWFPVVDNAVLLLGVIVVLAFSYLMWMILRGELGYPLIGGTQLDKIAAGIDAGRQALLYSLWLLVLLAMARHYKTESLGYLAIGAGLACWFGMPLLVSKYAPPNAAQQLQTVATDLMASFHASGVAMFVVGLLRIIMGRIVMMAYQPPSASVVRVPGILGPDVPGAAPQLAGRNSLMRKCWELHFCRGSVRTTCPRYVEGVACWRKTSGCYCDHDLASRLMSSVGGNASVKMQVAEELDAHQRKAQELQRRLQRQQQRSKQAARKLCRECPIYLEHQKFKYRTLSWLTYPLTAIIIALSAHSIRQGYDVADQYVAKFIGQYSLIPHELMVRQIEVAPWFSAENFAILIIGVILLAVILHLTEVAVFQLKL
jgi:hypothetical protein